MNGSTAAIRNPERWRNWARLMAARGVVSRRRCSISMQFALPVRLTFVRSSNYVFTPSSRWSLDLAFRLHSFGDRVFRHETTVLAGVTLGKSRTGLVLERTFTGGPAGRALAVLAESFRNRVQRIEERSSRTAIVTVMRVRPETRSGGDRMDSAGRSWPEAAGERASWAGSVLADSQMPAINVERITENVMRQIDHRLTAWRERMGRS